MQYFSLTLEEVLKETKSKAEGLKAGEIEERQKIFGKNVIPEEKPPAWYNLLFRQFRNALIYILILAAGINFGLVWQEYGRLTFNLANQADTYIILLAVLINVIVGYFQENKAQKSLEALKKIITLPARVVRGGREEVIDAKELVIGDIILVMAGDKVPADARLIEAEKLSVNEAPLTGESEPVDKVVEKLAADLVVGDQKNMIFTGTTVTKGEGRAVVINIGAQTEIGKIAKLLKETKDEETPLQQKLDAFSKQAGLVVLVLALILLVVGYLQGDPFLEIFTVAVAVSVSALPEGLAVGVTVILALGMQRILKQKALVRRLVAAETLGSTTVICTDKTGTLTEGKMQVTDVVTWNNDFNLSPATRAEKNEELIFALHVGMMCNDAKIDNIEADLKKLVISGNLTEQALLQAAIQAGLDYKKERGKYPRLDTIPFDSTIKYMATLHRNDKGNIVFFKGAPEMVLAHCQRIRLGDKTAELDAEKKKKFAEKFTQLSNKGLRVLALAYQHTDKEKLEDIDLDDLVFIGYLGIMDPLRPTSKETVKLCQQAGIKVVMITGDHKLTAQALARDLRLPCAEENVAEGMDLDKLSDRQLEQKVTEIFVYARVSPEHKLRIVKAWLKRGEVVAMTGDGINDSPALKAADIGVALGSGTQVAKETAEMVILDDHFKSIVGAVEEGRAIFSNIKKTVLYLMSDSFSEIILIIGSMIMGLPLPMTAAQILWINLVNDTLPNLALTQEPKEKEIMKEPPRGRKSLILDGEVKFLILMISLITGIMYIALFYFYYQWSRDLALTRTLVFVVSGLDSLMYVFSIRTLKHSLFKHKFLANKYLIGGVLISFGFLLAAVYVPFLQVLIKTKPLGWLEWALAAGLSLGVVLSIEMVKFIFISYSNRKKNA